MQAENFRKMLLTISKDIRVVLIKIADRLHNMRTLDSMPKEKQLRVMAETEYIYAPLAHRLGLYNIKSELEDLCLRYSDRPMYDLIQQKLKEGKMARNRFTRSFIKPIEEELRNLGLDFNIKARTKSVKSIYNKMKKQHIPFEEVYDLYAIRIIFDSDRDSEKAECWRIYSVVTDFYTPNVKRLRDWISVPKSNGYESLHTTVMGPRGTWVEVQIRSARMDNISEKGLAAHWKYKESLGADSAASSIDAWLLKVRELLENNDLNAIEFLDDFRANLFSKEVFVFTPRGDLKRFARGGTVLDFAFDIHTEVGARALGAKINGKLVPLNYELQNGDQVEILTSNKPKANEGWMKFVTTSKARSKIKDYLKEDKRQMAAEGREIIQRKLKHLKLPFDDSTIHQMMDYFGLRTEADLFYQVGNGSIAHTEIKSFREGGKIKAEEKKKQRLASAKDFKSKVKQIGKKEDELVIGEDMGGIDYSMSTCCNPVPGDDIFGFITVNSGIKVHRTNCPNSVSLMANFGYRIIRARWASDADYLYDLTIDIEGIDRLGLVNDITRVISNQHNINIKSINITSENSIFRGMIALLVHDMEELHKMVGQMEQIEGVVRITRNEEAI